MKLTRNQTLVIISIICLILVTGSFFYYLYDPYYFGRNGGQYYEGFDLYLSDDELIILFEEMNLSESNINHITNETFKLSIEIETPNGNESASYRYIKEESGGYIYPEIYWNNSISYRTNITNENYSFIIRWDINSTYPEVQNLSFFGSENQVEGSFYINSNFTAVVTFDEQYLDICNVVYGSGRAKIILPLNITIMIHPLILIID